MKPSTAGFLLAIALWSGLAQPLGAQTNVPAALPPAAQEALDKGIFAAKVPDFSLAIRYFEDARKLAPSAPAVFMNLGIAESKMPGRELRAIAWFGAYLAAYPDAPNAAAVREQIATLEVRNQSNLSRFLKTVQNAADSIRDEYGSRGSAQRELARVQIRAGDIAGARNNLAAAAKSAIDRTTGNEARIKTMVLTGIAKDQIKVGDARAARITLASAQKTADSINLKLERPQDKASEQFGVAEAQIAAGDLSGAQTTLASLQKTNDLIKDPQLKGLYQSQIARARRWVDEAQPKASVAAAAPATSPPAPDASRPDQAIAASDWLKRLDDDNKDDDCPLNTRLFLDLPGHLKSLPHSDDPQAIFSGLYAAAKTIITAQDVVAAMLKQQAMR